MAILRFLQKQPRLELHAAEPEETWFQRCYWLTLLVRELKAERDQLKAQNSALLREVNNGEQLTVTQEEFLAMREELNQLHRAKAKLDNRVTRVMQVNQSLLDEVNDLRNGISRAA